MKTLSTIAILVCSFALNTNTAAVEPPVPLTFGLLDVSMQDNVVVSSNVSTAFGLAGAVCQNNTCYAPQRQITRTRIITRPIAVRRHSGQISNACDVSTVAACPTIIAVPMTSSVPCDCCGGAGTMQQTSMVEMAMTPVCSDCVSTTRTRSGLFAGWRIRRAARRAARYQNGY